MQTISQFLVSLPEACSSEMLRSATLVASLQDTGRRTLKTALVP